MSLEPIIIDPKKYRILLILDASNVPRVIATDSQYVLQEFDNYSTNADELGIVDSKDNITSYGFYLWEGTIGFRDIRDHEDLYPEYEPEYRGTLTSLQLFDERLPSLLELEPEYIEERDSE